MDPCEKFSQSVKINNSRYQDIVTDNDNSNFSRISNIFPISEDTELIEVFPDPENGLTTINSDNLNIQEQKRDVNELLSSKEMILRNKLSPSLISKRLKKNVEHQPSVPKSKIREVSANYTSTGALKRPILVKSRNLVPTFDSSQYNDNTELENEINDSLLDMLQKNMGVLPDPNSARSKMKTNMSQSKEIKIFLPNTDGKIITLSVNGKLCRSNQQLTKDEFRLVSKILNHEYSCAKRATGRSYKNIYYDSESDTNIRYEVLLKPILSGNIAEFSSLNENELRMNKYSVDISSEASVKEPQTLSSTVKTHCSNISRFPQNSVQNNEWLKIPKQVTSIVEEKNKLDHKDYQYEEDHLPSNSLNPIVSSNNSGPFESNKKQFSLLSQCLPCNKGFTKIKLEEENRGLSDPKYNNEKRISAGIQLKSSISNIKNRGRVGQKLRVKGSHCNTLKKVLLANEVENVLKYATPVITNALSSWCYIVQRSKRIKKNNETLFQVLLNELEEIFQQVRSLSQEILKPVSQEENTSNVFTIEKDDTLQYVLGLTPGKYVISENEDWSMEILLHKSERKNLRTKDEYAALCSSIVGPEELKSDVSKPLQTQKYNIVLGDQNNSSFAISLPESVSVLSELSRGNESIGTEIIPNSERINSEENNQVFDNGSNTKQDCGENLVINASVCGDESCLQNQTFDTLVKELDTNFTYLCPTELPISSNNLYSVELPSNSLTNPNEDSIIRGIQEDPTISSRNNDIIYFDTNLEDLLEPNNSSSFIDFEL